MLAHIEAGALLPPLVVLQALARNPQLKLAVVKDYAARTLAAEGAAVEGDRKAIARFEEETAAMRAEAAELKTKVSGNSCLRELVELRELGELMQGLERCKRTFPDPSRLSALLLLLRPSYVVNPVSEQKHASRRRRPPCARRPPS